MKTVFSIFLFFLFLAIVQAQENYENRDHPSTNAEQNIERISIPAQDLGSKESNEEI